MNARRFVLSALLIAFVLAAGPARSDGSVTALVAARTTTGASSAIYAAASPAELGRETWFFLKSGDGSARLEISLDGGSTWGTLKRFVAGDPLATVPACGGCRFRVNTTAASVAATVTVGVSVSGAIVPTVTP